MKNVYFLSDAHLGSLAIAHRRTQERRLVRFLDSIKHKASAVYLLGDMFDFWDEYKYVVPKGFTRFLGKVSELTDMGVEVHFFTGNHDLWTYGYLEEECGVILHHCPSDFDHGTTCRYSHYRGGFQRGVPARPCADFQYDCRNGLGRCAGGGIAAGACVYAG